MSTTFFFDENRYDVAYLCPHAKTYFKVFKKKHWLEVKFPFFTVIETEVRNILFCCPGCYGEVGNLFNFCEERADFSRCFQIYFLRKEDLS